MRIIFFGSTSDSVLVLEKLITHHASRITPLVCAVVTQLPRPVGRRQIVTPTPVEAWAKAQSITVLSFPSDPGKPWLYADTQQVIDTLGPLKADLLVSACYGQKIPWEAIRSAPLGGLNVHPSILPRFRGADPVPWAILSGDHQAGVTVVTLSEKFDEGAIIAQKKISIMDRDTSDNLRSKLFLLGADLLSEALTSYGKNKRTPYPASRGTKPLSYARRLTRDDGFIPWELLRSAMDAIDIPQNERPEMFSFGIGHWATVIDRVWRALHPWPGVWTEIAIRKTKKRLKILRLSLIADRLSLDSVQLEGKKPVSWNQFLSAYHLSDILPS